MRDAVEERCGDDLRDEDADEVIDLVLLWWREGDGDLVDALINAIGPLADNGVIWVLTPKTGRSGHVEPSEIAEAALESAKPVAEEKGVKLRGLLDQGRMMVNGTPGACSRSYGTCSPTPSSSRPKAGTPSCCCGA